MTDVLVTDAQNLADFGAVVAGIGQRTDFIGGRLKV